MHKKCNKLSEYLEMFLIVLVHGHVVYTGYHPIYNSWVGDALPNTQRHPVGTQQTSEFWQSTRLTQAILKIIIWRLRTMTINNPSKSKKKKFHVKQTATALLYDTHFIITHRYIPGIVT